MKKIIRSLPIVLLLLLVFLFGEQIGASRTKLEGFQKIEFVSLDNTRNETDVMLALGNTYLSAAEISAKNELIYKSIEEKNMQDLISYLNKAGKKLQNSSLIENSISEYQIRLEKIQSDIEALNAFLTLVSDNKLNEVFEHLKNDTL